MTVEKTLQFLTTVPVIKSALGRLSKELPRNLLYHVASHTDDVMHEVVTFAVEDKRDDRDILLLAIGAAYHDIGFVDRLQENEELGAQMAQAAMKTDGSYSNEEIEQVGSMIRATQVKFTSQGPRQVPTTELSRYLLDADVSNLGRDDFFEKANLVRCEVQFARKEEFYKGLVSFMQAHEWYTPAAIRLRQNKKEENILKLKKAVEQGDLDSL